MAEQALARAVHVELLEVAALRRGVAHVVDELPRTDRLAGDRTSDRAVANGHPVLEVLPVDDPDRPGAVHVHRRLVRHLARDGNGVRQRPWREPGAESVPGSRRPSGGERTRPRRCSHQRLSPGHRAARPVGGRCDSDVAVASARFVGLVGVEGAARRRSRCRPRAARRRRRSTTRRRRTRSRPGTGRHRRLAAAGLDDVLGAKGRPRSRADPGDGVAATYVRDDDLAPVGDGDMRARTPRRWNPCPRAVVCPTRRSRTGRRTGDSARRRSSGTRAQPSCLARRQCPASMCSIEFDGPSTAIPGRIAALRGCRQREPQEQPDALSQCFIQRLVHELVGALVLLAPDWADRPLVEAPQLPHRLA